MSCAPSPGAEQVVRVFQRQSAHPQPVGPPRWRPCRPLGATPVVRQISYRRLLEHDHHRDHLTLAGNVHRPRHADGGPDGPRRGRGLRDRRPALPGNPAVRRRRDPGRRRDLGDRTGSRRRHRRDDRNDGDRPENDQQVQDAGMCTAIPDLHRRDSPRKWFDPLFLAPFLPRNRCGSRAHPVRAARYRRISSLVELSCPSSGGVCA